MNPIPELTSSLKQLRLSGILDTLEARNREAIDRKLAYTDFLTLLIQDEIARRDHRKLDARMRRANFRGQKTLEGFDFDRLPNLNRAVVHDLATCRFIDERVSVLIAGPCGTGKSHLAQALGHAAARQGHDVLFMTQTRLLSTLRNAQAVGSYERRCQALAKVPLLIIDDFGMRKLPLTAAEDLLEIIMRRYERASTLLTSNRPVEDWGKLLGDTAAVGSMLDRLLHHGHVLKCGPRSWRTKTAAIAEERACS